MDNYAVTRIVAGMGILWTLIGAVAGPPVNAWLNRRNEDRKWARERGFEACVSFMAETNMARRRVLSNAERSVVLEQLITSEAAIPITTNSTGVSWTFKKPSALRWT
jgi:hypothetical protein